MGGFGGGHSSGGSHGGSHGGFGGGHYSSNGSHLILVQDDSLFHDVCNYILLCREVCVCYYIPDKSLLNSPPLLQVRQEQVEFPNLI